MCMSPDTVECEHGFSSMNSTKDKFSTKLSQDNLQSHMKVHMDTRNFESFPWKSIK